jgi:hypothetical protein
MVRLARTSLTASAICVLSVAFGCVCAGCVMSLAFGCVGRLCYEWAFGCVGRLCSGLGFWICWQVVFCVVLSANSFDCVSNLCSEWGSWLWGSLYSEWMLFAVRTDYVLNLAFCCVGSLCSDREPLWRCGHQCSECGFLLYRQVLSVNFSGCVGRLCP